MHRTSRHRVEWGETDAAAIVYYPNYFRWFDRATHDIFADLDYPISGLLRRGLAIPLVDAGARFRHALAFGDEVRIESRVAEVRARTFRVEHTVHRAGVLVCEGYEVRMWVRVNSDGSLTGERIPDDVRVLLTGTAE